VSASLLRRFRRRYLEEHRALGGDPSAAALRLHRLLADAFLDCVNESSPRLLAFLAEFRWQLQGQPGALSPDVLADLLPLTLDPNKTGSHYTSGDVADYLARAVIVPCLLDSSDAILASNGDLQSALVSHIDGAYACEPEAQARVHYQGPESALQAEEEGLGLAYPRAVGDGPSGLRDPAALTKASLLRPVGPSQTLPTKGVSKVSVCQPLSTGVRGEMRQRIRTLTVLDPTCGTGAFLLAAFRLLFTLRRRLCPEESPGDCARAIVRNNLFGVDVQPEAIEVGRLRLKLEMHCLAGCTPEGTDHLYAGDVLPDRPDSLDVAALSPGGFDAILSNPPYVRLSKTEPGVSEFETCNCGDLSAVIVEQCFRWTRTGARLGLVVPISHFVTDGFASLQQLTLRSLDRLWVAFFANRPSQLFEGAQKRVALWVGRRGQSEQPQIHTTGYLRWHRHERPDLLNRLRFTPTTGFRVLPHSLEKIGSEREARILERMLAHPRLEAGVATASPHVVYYTRKFSYFLEFLNFVPRRTDRRTGEDRPPSELKRLALHSQEALYATIAALSSSTFFWFWNAISDGRNVNCRDLLVFPFNPETVPVVIRTGLAQMGAEYLGQLQHTNGVMRKGTLDISCLNPATLKPLLDRIDGVLAELYGHDADDVAFLVGYDQAYRLQDTSARLQFISDRLI